MGVKVATTCMHWSHPIVARSPSSSSQTLTSAISSPSKKRGRAEGALVCRYAPRLDRSSLFGTPSPTRLRRSSSCPYPKSGVQSLRRAFSASLDASSDEEFAEKIQELALKFQIPEGDDDDGTTGDAESELVKDSEAKKGFNEEFLKISGNFSFVEGQRPFPSLRVDPVEPPWLETREMPPDWPGGDEIIPESIERKANSVDLPLSLRIIKRKKQQWQEGFSFIDAGESAYCSVKKAFSSMVFIIRELHSYTLQMREILFYEDLQEILARVQKEMHASFVWLFQQVFSHTPTLMIYVMILLANFTVHSMSSHPAIAAPPDTYPATTETVSILETQTQRPQKFDSSAIKTFTVSLSTGKAASVGGNNGGGGKVRPIGSGTEGDGRFENSEHYRTVIPDGGSSQVSSLGREESVSREVTREEELKLWNSMVEHAWKMQLRDEALDHEIMQSLVSPVAVQIEPDEKADYFRTELLYQSALAEDPDNPLLLANFAQFLWVVPHDYDRAEEYFKRAVTVEPPDAEALNKYASFLWMVKNDLWAAEETYLEAISAEPTNSFYAANYAHFLWSTGGEDTCFPLDSPETEDADST